MLDPTLVCFAPGVARLEVSVYAYMTHIEKYCLTRQEKTTHGNLAATIPAHRTVSKMSIAPGTITPIATVKRVLNFHVQKKLLTNQAEHAKPGTPDLGFSKPTHL